MENEKILNFKSGQIITSVEAIVLKLNSNDIPLNIATPSFFNDGFLIIRIYTDQGLVGLGEPSTYGDTIANCKKFLINNVKEKIINRNITDIWKNIEALFADNEKISIDGQASILAALSQAILDLLGKELNLPIWNMIKKNNVENNHYTQKIYASGGMYYNDQPIELLINELEEVKDLKYDAWKVRPPIPRNLSHIERIKSPPKFDVRKFLEIIPKIKQLIDSNFKLMIDFGCRISNLTDLEYILDFCSDYGIFFLEEPVERDISKYKKIKNNRKVNIAFGEHLHTNSQIEKWISIKNFSIYQPDVNLAGYHNLQIIKKAKMCRKSIILHNWANGVSNFANFHFASLIEDCLYVEKSIIPNPLRDDLLNEEVNYSNGIIKLSDKPGLGITLNNKVIKRFQIN